MQLRADQLSQHIQQSLKPIYLVFGDESFLVQQALDTLRAAAKKQGFSERKQLLQNKEFDWGELKAATQEMSLFSAQIRIELELPDGSPGKEGAKAFNEFLETQSQDQLLLVFGPRVNKTTQNTKWFKSLAERGVYIPIYSPDAKQLPQYIQQRAKVHNVQLATDAIQQLAVWYEGNLLALEQELMKLKLRQPADAFLWQREALTDSVTDQSRFDIFALRDALISQSLKRYLHTLARLRELGEEPILISWTLAKLRTILDQLALAMATRSDVRSIFTKERIWPQQQSAFEQLARFYTLELNHHLLGLLERLEYAIKRDSGEDPFILFAQFGIALLRPQQVHQLPQLAPQQD
ncbi:MAG: DNA polymerase III delta subunit HolA [Idiomarinaceae bacterium HL-53]|nr:MAG: DNA polymerase III delta subunit HolA [Idiomarinaceae bacterium HL-53]CUS48759.1 DNA polymerase III, delta subunit [Idiomarinaceae bacterium HL-53]